MWVSASSSLLWEMVPDKACYKPLILTCLLLSDTLTKQGQIPLLETFTNYQSLLCKLPPLHHWIFIWGMMLSTPLEYGLHEIGTLSDLLIAVTPGEPRAWHTIGPQQIFVEWWTQEWPSSRNQTHWFKKWSMATVPGASYHQTLQ